MSPNLTGTPYGAKTVDLEVILGFLDVSGIVRPRLPFDSGRTVQLINDHLVALRTDGAELGEIRYGRIHLAEWKSLRQLWPLGTKWRHAIAQAGQRLVLAHQAEVEALLPAPPIWPTPAINVFGVTAVATDQAWQLCKQSCPVADDAQACWEMICFVEGLVDDLLVATLFEDNARNQIIRPLLGLLKAGIVPIGWVGESFECFRLAADGEAAASGKFERVALPTL